jgi:hypothetical protein
MAAALVAGSWEALRSARAAMVGIEQEAPLRYAYRKALRKLARDRRRPGTSSN